MKIIVDADACPKVALGICRRLGQLARIPVWTVASFNHHIISDNHIVVGSGSQEADIKIINLTEAGDLVVTQDWGLAAMVLGKQASCISPTGREYCSEKIEFLLEERETKAKLRRGGGRTKGPKKRTNEDDQAFEAGFSRLLNKRKGVDTMSLPLRVYFDFSCPYCYIAWGFMKKLKANLDISDDWVTWEIHPDIPAQGEQIQNVVAGVNLEARKQKLNLLGQPAGLAPGGRTFVPNTRLALEATEFAIDHGMAHAWIDAVYHASFVEEQNIGDQEVLLAIAQRIGLDADVLAAKLNTGYYSPRILSHDKECADKQIEWVPTVYSGDEKIIEGAFSYDEFREAVQAFASRAGD